MNIIKSIISILLLIPYVLLFATFDIGVTFPDGTTFKYHGWLERTF